MRMQSATLATLTISLGATLTFFAACADRPATLEPEQAATARAMNPGTVDQGLVDRERELPPALSVISSATAIVVPGPFPVPPFIGTTIDFEGWGEGTLIDNQYSGLGVTFTQDDGGRPMIDNKSFLFAYESLSGVGVLTGSKDGGAPFFTVAGLIAVFDPPMGQAGAYLSDTGPLGNYDVTIFDAGGATIDFVTVTSSDFPVFSDPDCDSSSPWNGTGCGLFVGFDAGSDIIAKIQFGPSTATGDAFAIDDLVFASVNQPPDCSAAAASPDALWPPNHQFTPIEVVGVTDPDGDPVTITIDAIWQDEPTDTFGDGRFTPDGQGLGSSTAEVRAERAGTKKVPGNGRVYHISFTADDGQGGSCSSTVLVGVPHDRAGDPAVDDGPLYDSTI